MEEKTTKYFPSNEPQNGYANRMWITPTDLLITMDKWEAWEMNIIG